MVHFADFTPEQWLLFRDSINLYKPEGHDDPADPEKSRWDIIREESAQHTLKARNLYQSIMTVLLEAYGVKNPDPIAVDIVNTIFDWTRDDETPCVCSCHPRLPSSDLHGYGMSCDCMLSAEERKQAFDEWKENMDSLWADPAFVAQREANDQEQDALDEWISSQPDLKDFRQLSAACPEQWQGIISNRPFYFRERHGAWRIELGDVLAASEEPLKIQDSEFVKGFTTYFDTDDYTEIAQGVIGQLGGTATDHLKFVVKTIREYLSRQSCNHKDWVSTAGKFCPACGIEVSTIS